MTAEEKRLEEARTRKAHWQRWGPYVSDRAWGTVREDYSATGEAWEYFPHDHARSRAYRWNEDGLAAICDRHQHVCFGLALWNEQDPILKEDILIRIIAHNRGPEAAPLRLLPTIWFRNTWSWQNDSQKPVLKKDASSRKTSAIALEHPQAGKLWLYAEGAAETLFTENETNTQRLYGYAGPSFAKDGINDYIVQGRTDAVNPAQSGTKASVHYSQMIPAGGSAVVKLRLTNQNWSATKSPVDSEFDRVFAQRLKEA